MIEDLNKQHYNLFASVVTFRMGDDVHTANSNTLTADYSDNVSMMLIGKAQQQMQANIAERMQKDAAAAGIAIPPLEFLDVSIVSVSYLGLMTKEEFYAPPEGMVMAEQQPTTEAELKNMIFGTAE